MQPDCASRMVMDLVPQETKEEHLDSAFNFASNAINEVANACYQVATNVGAYIAEEAGLIIDYVGEINLREDALKSIIMYRSIRYPFNNASYF